MKARFAIREIVGYALLLCSALLFAFPSIAVSATFVTGLSKPTGLAIHPTQRFLYVKSGAGGTVWKVPITPAGTAGQISVVTDQFEPPLDIKFDVSGNLYGMGPTNPADVHVVKLNSAGSVCSTNISFGRPTSSGIAIESPGLSSNDLFFHMDDYLYSVTASQINCNWADEQFIGDSGSSFNFLLYRASRSDLVGSWSGGVSIINTGDGSVTPLVSNLSQPNGLAEDSDGNLYIAVTGTGKIVKRNNLGGTVEFMSNLVSPVGLAYDAQTRLLFVSEMNADRIMALPVDVYTISGTVTAGGAPVPGVSVVLSGPVSRITTTGADGSYAFGSIENGTYTITPTKTGYTFSPPNRSLNVAGADELGQDFTVNLSSLPNLKSCKPAGWSNKLVVTQYQGSKSDSRLDYGYKTYVNWAVANLGKSNINNKLYVRLYIDGRPKKTWSIGSMKKNTYKYIVGYSIGGLSRGRHQIKIIADTPNRIIESSENDNSYTRTVSVH